MALLRGLSPKSLSYFSRKHFQIVHNLYWSLVLVLEDLSILENSFLISFLSNSLLLFFNLLTAETPNTCSKCSSVIRRALVLNISVICTGLCSRTGTPAWIRSYNLARSAIDRGLFNSVVEVPALDQVT